jgi:hypothetical protein
MTTIQNLKNFIRHGKQARGANAEPTTNVSNVHAQHQPVRQAGPGGVSEPNLGGQKNQYAPPPIHDNFSAAAVDNRNVAARAENVAAHVAGEHQKKGRDVDAEVLQRIVAEERQSRGKFPNYPGLERWILVEKMGDGAFSNVYRARDTQGQYGEVAIKVVRKFEMNSTQVSQQRGTAALFLHASLLSTPFITSLHTYTS